ncbi:MAG: histone deacetylase [Thermoplasmatota archaeon]
MTTQIAYSNDFSKHNNSGHPENAKRLEVLVEEVKHSPIYEKLDFFDPNLVSEKTLYKLHSEYMIQRIKEISSSEDEWVDLDTYVCRYDYETARKAAGGVVQICHNVISGKADNGFALIRPPGHHATYERPMGFCLFNNAALAAYEIAQKGKSVLIFDCDVHHGNGTQNSFYDRSDVLFQSFHLYPHFPGTGPVDNIGKDKGEGYTVNAPLCYGNGDKSVSILFEEIFSPIAQQFKPDLIIVSSGYDSHHSDPLGGLKLTVNFFGKIIEYLQKIQPKIVCTLEGGYSLDWIGKCLLSQLGQLTGQAVEFNDTVREDINVQPVIKDLKKNLESFWKL